MSTSAFGKAVSVQNRVQHVSKSSIKMNFDSTGSLEPIRVESFRGIEKHELTGLVPGLLDWSGSWIRKRYVAEGL